MTTVPVGAPTHVGTDEADRLRSLVLELWSRTGWHTLTEPLDDGLREVFADVVDGRPGEHDPVERWWRPEAGPEAAASREPGTAGWFRIADGTQVSVTHPALQRRPPSIGVVHRYDPLGARYEIGLDDDREIQWVQAFRVRPAV